MNPANQSQNVLSSGRRWLLLFATLALVACSQSPSHTTTRDYALTIQLSDSDTLQGLEQRYGGKVAVWQPEAGFAILEMGQEATSQLVRNQNTLSLEPNLGVFQVGSQLARISGASSFWSDGASSFWSGGASSFWSDGASSFWSGGVFQWMPDNTQSWQQISLQQAHAKASNLGLGVKIAVIDTGVDLKHPALVQAIAPASEQWDFVDKDAIPQEEGQWGLAGYGHGTNVAGIIRQVAPRATILPIRVMNPQGRGNVADVAAGIIWAVNQGAQIINLSLGSQSLSTSVETAILVALSKDVLVVASTGNSGDNRVSYPASAARTSKQRISVSSVGHNDVKSIFATFGGSVEITAPGETLYGPAPDNRKTAWSGTSMAAAVVSGAAALALGESLKVPRADLLHILWNQADNIYQIEANKPYKDLLGGGRINIAKFLSRVMTQ